jgi:ADP-heptose:LPS heptosyltransferase
MGDVAMTVPVLSAFSETHPTIKLTVLTKKQFAPLFRDLKMVSVISVDFKTDYKGVVGLYRLSKALRNTQVEAVADLHNVLRTKVLKLFLPRIKFIQIDKGRAEKKALITAKKRTPLRTMIQRYADVFRSLGFEFELDKPSFTAPKLLDAATTKKLGAFSNSSIGIAPFAAYASKTYSISKMDEVISKLQDKSKLLLFGGGAKEIKQLEAIASKYSNVFCVAGKFSLAQLMASRRFKTSYSTSKV